MQAILQHIFQKNSLQEVPLEALQQLTEQYPFFGPGQFLLARKLVESKQEGFLEQIKKTALYFSNPLWLAHLLTATPEDADYGHISGEAGKSSGNDAPPVEDKVNDPVGEPANENGRPAPLLKELLHGEAVSGELELPALHTIDYFASQGIRLRAEEEADKLGKQLKSFTEWLKTMRRLPQAATPQVAKINEEAIYQQASGSLEEREIVTETMAEVLVKQQNTQKAIQIYTKLGLQYPSKKAYFAAKIQALNNSI